MFKPIFYVSVILLIFSLQCNTKNSILSYGKEYFNYIDQGKYDLAYNMLSDEDKKYASFQDYSSELNEIRDYYCYPNTLDSTKTFSLNPVTDSAKSIINSKTPFPNNIKNVYIFREIRRMPDFSSSMKNLSDNFTEKLKELKENILSGNFSTIPDSSRFTYIINENNKLKIYIGAKYWKNYYSLLNEYSNFLKKSLQIKIDTAKVYKTINFGISGIIDYTIKNNLRDTMELYSFKVKGIFNNISTEPISAFEEVLPGESKKGSLLFDDSSLLIVLGDNDSKQVDAKIEITKYPTEGHGSDFDSIMTSKQNAKFYEFSSPIREGVEKVIIE